jgi:phospholipase/lecithinase/hemolysin
MYFSFERVLNHENTRLNLQSLYFFFQRQNLQQMWGKCWDVTNQIAKNSEENKLKALVNEELPTYIFDEGDKLYFKCAGFK